MKLARAERETDELRETLGNWPQQVTSVVGDVEVRRVAVREGTDAEAVLVPLSLIELDWTIRRTAASVGSPGLRSLDAIHLATALSLGDDLGAFCGYDRRLLADAEAAGLTVLSPGRGGIGET